MSSWKVVGFIPELRLGDKIALSAWKIAPLLHKSVIVNFCDLTARRLLQSSPLRRLERELKESEATIISTVGSDDLLDELVVTRIHDTALKLGADWVITPDDYVYDSDIRYPFYQDSHFSRALRRAIQLVTMARGQYGVIGLAIGSSTDQLQEFVRTLEEYGINDFAFACGDLLKQGKNPKRTIIEISNFVNHLRASKHSSLLLGIDSPRYLRLLAPDSWASSSWSIDAAHQRYYANDGTKRKGRGVVCSHDFCKSGQVKGMELLGVHNLLADENFLTLGRN